MDDSSRQIKIGAIISYIAIGINIITALLYLPWMADTIGQENYGLYTLATSFINMFLIDFGLNTTVARYVAKYRAEQKEDKVEILLAIVVRIYLYIDGVIFVLLSIVYFFIDQIYAGLTVNEINIFKTLYIIVGIFSLISFPFSPVSGVLTAYEKFIQLKLCDLGQKLFNVFLIILALFNGYGVVAVVGANAVSGLLFIIIKLYFVKKTMPITLSFRTTKFDELKEIIGFSVWAAVMSLAQRLMFNIAPSILGIVSNSKEIAVFAPASALEGYFYTFAAAVNGMFLSKISRCIADNNNQGIFTLMVKVGRYQMLTMGLIFVGFICVGKEFMLNWMGIEYSKAWACALLMFIPDFFGFTEQIAATTVIAKNEVKRQAISSIYMVLAYLVLSFVLSKHWGATGTCFAIACAYTVFFIYMNFIYKKVLKIDIITFFKECYHSFFLPFCIVVISGWSICNVLLPSGGWKWIIIKVIIIIAIYSVIIYVMGLNKSEKQIVRRIICFSCKKDGGG